MLDDLFMVTFFSDKTASYKVPTSTSLQELCEKIDAEAADKKTLLPWVKLAEFGNVKTDKGSLRHDANVTVVHGCEGDYDGEKMSFDEAEARLRDAGIGCILHTSPSHTPAAPRWRVLAPTSKPLRPEFRITLLARINGVLGGVLADESFKLSQSYYYGHVEIDGQVVVLPDEGEEGDPVPGENRVVAIDGRYIDQCSELDAGAIGKQPGTNGNGHDAAGEYVHINRDELTRRILSGEALHTSVISLAGSYAARSIPWQAFEDYIGLAFAAANQPRYTGRWEECLAAGRWAYLKEAKGGTAPLSPDLVVPLEPVEEWDAGDDPGPLPPREWLLGNEFCKGFVSSVVAAGGTGKSALRLLQLISIACNKPLCGQYIFRRARVLFVSLEDNRAEVDKRIKAIVDHYGLDREKDLKGWFTCWRLRKTHKLAVLDAKRMRQVGNLDRLLRERVAKAAQDGNPIDLVCLDPYVKLHGLDENSSGDMNFVGDILDSLVVDLGIAIDAPHHVHKGTIEPGDADAGRGSSGIRDAARINSTLCSMSKEEAERFGVPVELRRQYVRLDPAKVNIAPPAEKATWFKLASVPLGNATPGYPNGDSLQVIEPWKPPALWDASDETLNHILDDISAGIDKGARRYSAAPASTDRAVWPVVHRHLPTKTEAQCRAIVSVWMREGVLFAEDYADPAEHKQRKGLYVNDAKRPGTHLRQ